MPSQTKQPTAWTTGASGAWTWDDLGTDPCEGGYASRCPMTPQGNTVTDEQVQLRGADGNVKGNDKADATFWPDQGGPRTYGGPGDLWGTTWTPADVNDADFGLFLQGVDDDVSTTDQVIADECGFTIPSTATITGIGVTINRGTDAGPGQEIVAILDCIQITVYYEAGGGYSGLLGEPSDGRRKKTNTPFPAAVMTELRKAQRRENI